MNDQKYGMPPPTRRKEFENNIFLLLEDGERIIKSGSDRSFEIFVQATYKHTKRIKKRPNSRINFLTINEQARLQANMKMWMQITKAK